MKVVLIDNCYDCLHYEHENDVGRTLCTCKAIFEKYRISNPFPKYEYGECYKSWGEDGLSPDDINLHGKIPKWCPLEDE